MNDLEKLKNYLSRLSLDISDDKLIQLLKYIDILYEWNNKINLTAIPKEKAILLHLVDSLSLAKVVDLKQQLKVIDIGTGAGFPGIPIKIAYPDIDITLVDSTRKKLNFIELAIKPFNIDVNLVHARAENLSKDSKFNSKFDLVVARAVAELDKLVKLLIPFCKRGGKLIAMKGPNIADEIKLLDSSIKKLKVNNYYIEKFNLIDHDIERSLVVIER